jgi:hypothetical protein
VSTEAEREAFEAWFDAWRLEDCPYDPTEPQRRARWGTYFRNCTWEAWQARASLASAPAQGVEAALKAARQFIRNGVEFGYIRMPDPDTSDSALATLPMIEDALAALSQGEQKK